MTTDKLDLIFENQHKLANKYLPIEVENKMCWDPAIPVNIDAPLGQMRIKDFMWRTTEELTEAAQQYHLNGNEMSAEVVVELIDALHFMVELCMIADLSPVEVIRGKGGEMAEPLPEGKDKLDILWDDCLVSTQFFLGVYQVIHLLGTASNCLKARAWKKSHPATDAAKFYEYLQAAVIAIVALFRQLGITSEMIYIGYLDKSSINEQRIANNY